MTSSRNRAGILLLGLALVGGTGCVTTAVTTAVLSDAHDRRVVRDEEQGRLKSIAELTPRAEAGDAAAMTTLAQALMSARDKSQNDVPRARDWLSRAAGQEYGLAQAILGDLLTPGSAQPASGWMRASQPDHERGIALLQKAAVKACIYYPPRITSIHGPPIYPARRLGEIAGFDHRERSATLWYARSILHCGEPSPYALAGRVDSAPTAEQKRTRFAELLLTGASAVIERTRVRLAPEDVAGAERQAAALRMLVAESEKQYPAPPRKETR